MKRLLAGQRTYTYDISGIMDDPKCTWKIIFLLFAFVLCVGVCVAPLQRWVETPFLSPLAITSLLVRVGAWLPVDLNLLADVHDSKITTSNGEFLFLVALLFILYGICAWYMYRRAQSKAQSNARSNVHDTRLLFIIIACIIVTGLIFVFTPALPSLDIFAYADYGRTIFAHNSNPYFVSPLRSSPYDPITKIDGWNYAITAYGPFWLLICSFVALLSGVDPVHYLFAFRMLGFLAHLLNVTLIIGILTALGRPKSAILLGVFLYGCNPLILLESCLSGHNDVLVGTFTLLGIWLLVRGENKDFTRPKRYVPSLLAFSMAVLIKFTAAPLLLFFLFLLLHKTLYPSEIERYSLSQISVQRWALVLRTAWFACLTCGLVMLLFYAPFWLGHSISAIYRSFSAPPSSNYAENSLLRLFIEWIKRYGFPSQGSWFYGPFYFLSRRTTWNTINLVTVGVTLLGGAFLLSRAPTIQSLLQATLIVLEAVLLVTPWFFSWYILWLIPLAVILFVGFDSRKSRATIFFAFVFSASAFFIYIRPYYIAPFDGSIYARYLLTDVPPLVTLIFCIYRKKTSTRSAVTRVMYPLE